MKNAFVLAGRDAASYFRSWTGVLTFVFFLLIASVLFCILIFSYAQLSLSAAQSAYEDVQGLGTTRFIFGSFFLNLGVVLIFLAPILSMRAFAEERKQQTLELLYTYPLSDFEIVWGKYLGMVWFFEMLMIPTAIYIWLMHWLGIQLDWGPILMGYLGFWLLGSAYLTLGLFVSSLTENQILSALVTFACLIIFWILEWVAATTDGTLSQVLSALSPLDHYREFTIGILDLSHVMYFLFFHFYFLFLTLRAVESRNWKG